VVLQLFLLYASGNTVLHSSSKLKNIYLLLTSTTAIGTAHSRFTAAYSFLDAATTATAIVWACLLCVLAVCLWRHAAQRTLLLIYMYAYKVMFSTPEHGVPLAPLACRPHAV
jgi:hypothetical protein